MPHRFLHVSATPQPRCTTSCYAIVTWRYVSATSLYVVENVPEFRTCSKFRYVEKSSLRPVSFDHVRATLSYVAATL